MLITDAMNRRVKLFAAVLCGGILLYWKQITEFLANGDGVNYGPVYKNSWGWEATLGRFLLRFIQEAKGNVINTAFTSIMCLVFLSAACVLIVDLFGISNSLHSVVIGLIVIASPWTGSLLTFYFCSDAYGLSFLLAVGAVYVLFLRENRDRYVWAAVLLSLSLGLYQAYLSIFLTLLLAKGIQLTIREQPGVLFRKAFCGLLSAAAGIVSYLILNRAYLYIYQISASSDRGFDSMGQLELTEIIGNVASTYIYFGKYYLGTSLINNSVGFRREINVIYFLLLAMVLLYTVVWMKEMWRRITFCVLVMLIPLAVMSVLVYAPDAGLSILMAPAVSVTYMLGSVLSESLFGKVSVCEGSIGKEVSSAGERKEQKSDDSSGAEGCHTNNILPTPPRGDLGRLHRLAETCRSRAGWLLLLAEILVVYWTGILNVQGQAYLEYCTNKMYFVACNIVNAVEECVDDSENYSLYIAGTMENGNYPDRYEELRESLHWTLPYERTVWEDTNAQYCWKQFIRDVLGVSYIPCSADECAMLDETGILDDMNNFPDTDSVMVVDDQYIIIKLSDS